MRGFRIRSPPLIKCPHCPKVFRKGDNQTRHILKHIKRTIK